MHREMDKVYLHTTHRVRCRYIEGSRDQYDMLRRLSGIVRELKMLPLETLVKITSVKAKAHQQPKTDAHFSNICGKILHRPDINLVREGIRPLLVPVKNGFGSFMALYSRHVNLIIYHNQCCTLFRGGRNTAHIKNVIDHTLNSDFIMDTSMHMFVVSAGMGNSIAMKCTFIDSIFENDSRWTVSQDKAAECESSKNFKMTAFDKQWLETVCEHEVIPLKSVLITISIGGNVNFFISPQESVKFEVGIENYILPFCKFFMSLLQELL